MIVRGFEMMIRIEHRSVSSGFVLAATSYVLLSFHEEPEHEVSVPAMSSVLQSHLLARKLHILVYIWIYPRFCWKTRILKSPGNRPDRRVVRVICERQGTHK